MFSITSKTAVVLMLLCYFVPCVSQQKTDAARGINWPSVTGNGYPDSSKCDTAHLGMPYTDTLHNLPYVCSLVGTTPTWSNAPGTGVDPTARLAANAAQTTANAAQITANAALPANGVTTTPGGGLQATTVAAGTLLPTSPLSPMPHWRAKLNALKNGSGFPRVGIIGDSTLFGQFATVATSPGVDFCLDITAYYGVACQWGSWFGGGNPGSGTYWQVDPRIVAGTGWGIDSSVPTVGIEALTQSASGGALTFTPAQNVDTFEVYYIQQPSGGVLNVSIDGGTAWAINTAGAASMQKAVFTASGVGYHTISHAWASGGKVDLVGNISYDSTTPSVLVVLMSAGGATSAQLSSTSKPYSPGNAAPYSTVGLDAAVLEAGLINDWFSYSSPSTSQTNIQTLVSALQTAGADVALYTPVPSNPTSGKTQAVQSSFVAAMKAIAAANKNANTSSTLPVIDNFSQWQSYAAHSSWYGDGAVHPNATGYQVNAQAVETALMQSEAQSSGFNLSPWLAGQGFLATSLAPAATVTTTYTVTCTEGAIYSSGGTLTLPTTCPANYQIEIIAFAGVAVTLSTTNAGANLITSIPSHATETVQYVGGNWWTIGYTSATNAGGITANSLTLNSTVVSGDYTVLGTEGALYVNGGTITLPGSGLKSGFTLPILNYGASATISVGTNHGIPATLASGSGMLIEFYSNTWYAIAVPPLQVFSGTTANIGGSALAAGQCVSGNATVTGVGSYTQVPSVAPTTYPGAGFIWKAYVASANTVTVEVCAIAAGTPTATTYNVRVNQ